jgi:hypothetical protein
MKASLRLNYIQSNINRLSRNVGKGLPLYAAYCPRRSQISSSTLRRNPEITNPIHLQQRGQGSRLVILRTLSMLVRASIWAYISLFVHVVFVQILNSSEHILFSCAALAQLQVPVDQTFQLLFFICSVSEFWFERYPFECANYAQHIISNHSVCIGMFALIQARAP